MPLSPNAKLSIMAQESDDREIALLTVTHPKFTQTLYLSTDATQYLYDEEDTATPVYGTVSRGKEYIYLPIQATLPSSESDKAPAGSFSISNVSTILSQYLIVVDDDYPRVTVEIVLASDPDTVIQSWPEFELTTATLDATTATVQIAMPHTDNEPSPWLRLVPAYFPNAFI